MGKVNLTLYVDKNLIESAKKAGINLSVFFENTLKELLNCLNNKNYLNLGENSRQIWDYEKAFGKLCEIILRKIIKGASRGKLPDKIILDKDDLKNLLAEANKHGLSWLGKYEKDESRQHQHLVDTGKEIIVRYWKSSKGESYKKGGRYQGEFNRIGGKASYVKCTIELPISAIKALFSSD